MLWNLHASHVIREVASKVGSRQTTISEKKRKKDDIQQKDLSLFVLFQEFWLTAVILPRVFSKISINATDDVQ